jgi:hypothetical protein
MQRVEVEIELEDVSEVAALPAPGAPGSGEAGPSNA